MFEDERLQKEIFTLQKEHKSIDGLIADLARKPVVDQLKIQRLKKRKLHLKDEISKLESQMHPDIIA